MYHLNNIKDFLIDLGEELLDLQKKEIWVSEKEDGTKASEADVFCEEKVLEFLKQDYPYPIISEENSSEENPQHFLTDEKTWILDPIDGTSHFLKQQNDFSIMLALVENKLPLFSIIYAPGQGKGYFAQRGKGAYLFYENRDQEDKPIRVDDDTQVQERIFLLSNIKQHQKEYQWFQDNAIAQYRLGGSIGLKICQIAEGNAHYYLNTKDYLKIWDVLPPHLIIEEAGGVISDIYGNPLSYSSHHYQLKQGLFVAPDLFFKNPFPYLAEKITR